ncbi:aldolase/citrate lyase family protein [Aquisphaera insulae]|uniref:aldolase/citrate lyase family protein n=1 Tax=Aquisphaera insulae TaxID=2712864 RepID=UPI0013EDB289|nr:aldolase/citrate lyase family protein [Aquisphaera insulae]
MCDRPVKGTTKRRAEVMNPDAIGKLRGRLAADVPALGLWVTLESPSITEMAVGLGLDWVVIDAEHGHLDWKEIVEHLRACARSDTVALVRIAELNGGLIKRALDLGADGVVVPWVESADQVRRAVACARYAPEGTRGIGAERATGWGECLAEHAATANDHVLVVPIIETVGALCEVEAMSRVDGVEVFFFGPADLSATVGHRGQWQGPGVAEAILSAKDVFRRAGKHCGVVAAGEEDLVRRGQQGFRMIGVGLDGGLFLGALHRVLKAAGRDRRLGASPAPGPASAPGPVPLARPPESFRPDRPEVIAPVGSGPRTEIERGVVFECLVGTHNRARNLTTGLVTFAPGAELPCHTHPFGESITLVRGRAAIEADGRDYELGPLDNAVIPAGLAHHVRNLSAREPAVFHIAMATDAPVRTLVERPVPRTSMPAASAGTPGAERINRHATAPRFAAGPNTEFIDFFNVDLMEGMEMSGGYGLFHPGGRLPAHIHDFDESICILSGRATCVVEGRRHAMSDAATALQPRGRVHYFINESDGPMEMLWVYAGPRPERIVVDEGCATAEGDPWR